MTGLDALSSFLPGHTPSGERRGTLEMQGANNRNFRNHGLLGLQQGAPNPTQAF